MTTTPSGDEPRQDRPDGFPPPGFPPPPPGFPPPPPPGYQGFFPPPPGDQPPSSPGFPLFGSQQPGYQQPGYQQPPPAPSSLFGVALSDGWRTFGRVGGVFVGAAVVWALIGVAVLAIVGAIFGGLANVVGSNGGAARSVFGLGFSVGAFFVGIIAVLIATLVQAQFVRVALLVTRGHRPVFAEFFRFEHAGPVVVLALIVGVAEGVLRVIPVVGFLLALVVQFFLLFAYYVLLDRHTQPVDAIRGSVELTQRSLGQTVVFYLLAALHLFVGALLCGIGLVIALPVVVLSTANLYRRLTGEQPRLPA